MNHEQPVALALFPLHQSPAWRQGHGDDDFSAADRRRTPQNAMAEKSFTVRRLASNSRVEAGSWRAIRELCCRTGDNGRPVAPQRWDFFPRIWVDPYEKLLPQWTYVAEAGGVVAYLTGCPNTKIFDRTRFFRCTLPLLVEIARGRYGRSPDARRFVRRALGLEKQAESCFPFEIRRRMDRQYPAHLHINVDSAFRGVGIGRRLVGDFISDLRAIGAPGVHVYCGPDPLPFYRRLAFQELGSTTFRGGTVHALGFLC